MNGQQHELGIHVTECLGQCENDKVSIFHNESLISNPVVDVIKLFLEEFCKI